VRVVAGEARGRRLVAPEGRDIRPTGARVREAIFNALTSLDAIDGATVLDLFAGSGALGIEALSRGASHATFVERDRRTRRVIDTNLAATGLGDRATVIVQPAEQFLAETAAAGAQFGVAVLDPPYAYDRWHDLLAQVPCDLAVIETDRQLELPGRWELVRNKWYGSTLVVIARATVLPADGAAGGG
jgi:16S rRNA (guanine966-N2)-methyltransferase